MLFEKLPCNTIKRWAAFLFLLFLREFLLGGSRMGLPVLHCSGGFETFQFAGLVRGAFKLAISWSANLSSRLTMGEVRHCERAEGRDESPKGAVGAIR